MSYPMVFHTLMFAAASFDLASQGLSIEDAPQDLFYSEGEAIKCLNREMANPKTASTEAVIYTVLVSTLHRMASGSQSLRHEVIFDQRLRLSKIEAKCSFVNRNLDYCFLDNLGCVADDKCRWPNSSWQI
jgi:hypothetical protein